ILIVNKFDSFKYNNNIIIHSNAKISSDVNVNIIGTDNVIDVGDSVILRRLNINILGNNCKLIIKNNCSIRGAIHLRQNNSVIIIDSYTTSVSANIFSMEGSEINIGSNCMLSSSVYIRNSDEHPIYDLESNERINHAKPVFIGNNVWLCEGVTVNKGSIIPDGCVIGAKSFVSKELKRKNSIYSGVPAQLIRENIKWDRTFK
ncbi:TPA: hypothetical protein ACH9QW_004993, partial [Escherichia coli]